MPITATEEVSLWGYSEECQVDGEILTDPTRVFVVNGKAMCERHYDILMMQQIKKNGGEFY